MAPYGAAPKTNGMAIAALIVALVGCGLNFLGIIFGVIALNQIKASNGTQTGEGLAKAGIIVGAILSVGMLLLTFIPGIMYAIIGSSMYNY
jgi:hypothetical protein